MLIVKLGMRILLRVLRVFAVELPHQAPTFHLTGFQEGIAVMILIVQIVIFHHVSLIDVMVVAGM